MSWSHPHLLLRPPNHTHFTPPVLLRRRRGCRRSVMHSSLNIISCPHRKPYPRGFRTRSSESKIVVRAGPPATLLSLILQNGHDHLPITIIFICYCRSPRPIATLRCYHVFLLSDYLHTRYILIFLDCANSFFIPCSYRTTILPNSIRTYHNAFLS